jgi:hypothetical protein
MGGGGAGLPSGSRTRRDGAVDPPRSAPRPAAARTRPPSFAARYTSAACRTGCPRHGSARSPSGGPPEPALASHAWRSHPAARGRPALAGRAGSRSRRPGAPWADRAAATGGGPLHRRQGCRRGVQGRRQQAIVAAVGRRRHGCQRDAGCLAGNRALEALLAAVDRLGPATWPPPGALVIQPSMARCSGSKPCSRSWAARASWWSCSARPKAIHSSRRRRSVVAEQEASAMRR